MATGLPTTDSTRGRLRLMLSLRLTPPTWLTDTTTPSPPTPTPLPTPSPPTPTPLPPPSPPTLMPTPTPPTDTGPPTLPTPMATPGGNFPPRCHPQPQSKAAQQIVKRFEVPRLLKIDDTTDSFSVSQVYVFTA